MTASTPRIKIRTVAAVMAAARILASNTNQNGK